MDSLNNIPNVGNWGDAASKLNDNFNKVKQAVTTVENTSKNNKGYFTSLSALNTAFPSPKAGQTAYVYDEASSTNYYIYNAVNGAWVTTSIEAPSVGVDISEYTKTGGSTKTTKDIDDTKANHGYPSAPKTLKEVDDDSAQLAGNPFILNNTGIERETGEEMGGSNVVSTPFLPVSQFDTLTITGYNASLSTLYAFYDEHKNHISSYGTDSMGFITVLVEEIPNNAVFVRATGLIGEENRIPITTSALNEKLDRSEGKLTGIPTWIPNTAISKDTGEIQTSNSLNSTGFIPIDNSIDLNIFGVREGNTYTPVAYYNEKFRYVGHYEDGVLGVAKSITVPSSTLISLGVKFIKASFEITSITAGKIGISSISIQDAIRFSNSLLNKTEDAVEESVNITKKYLATEDRLNTGLTLTIDGYRHKDTGDVTTSASAKTTALIPVDKSKTYKVSALVTGQRAAGVCYFDSEDSFISSELTSEDGATKVYDDVTLTIPIEAVSFAFSSHGSFSLSTADVVEAAPKTIVNDVVTLLRRQIGVELSVLELMREQQLKFEYMQSGIQGSWYGVEWNESDPDPDNITRIGTDMSLHVTLPIHNKMRRCVTKDREVQYYLDNNNSLLKEDGSAADLTGVDGIVQVELPELFYKVEVEDGGMGRIIRLKLSEYAIPDFTYFPKQYISAFEATMDSANNALVSVATAILSTVEQEVIIEGSNTYIKSDTGFSLGTQKVATISDYTANASQYRGGINNSEYDNVSNELDTNYSRNQLGRPIGNLNRKEFSDLAQNTSDKHYIYQYSAHQMLWVLATVEYATRNIQKAFSEELTVEGYKTGGLGVGACRYPDYDAYEAFFAPQGGIPSIPCGTTISKGNNSGVVFFQQKNVPVESTGSGTSIVYDRWGDVYWPCISYRGVEHPYGHSHKVADGINIMTEHISGEGSETLVDVSYYVQNNPFYTHNENNNKGYKPLGTYRYTSHIREVSSIMAQPDAITLPINAVGGNYNSYYCDANEYKQHTPNVYYLALGGRFSSAQLSGFLFHYADYSVVQLTRKPTYVTRICHR